MGHCPDGLDAKSRCVRRSRRHRIAVVRSLPESVGQPHLDPHAVPLVRNAAESDILHLPTTHEPDRDDADFLFAGREERAHLDLSLAQPKIHTHMLGDDIARVHVQVGPSVDPQRAVVAQRHEHAGLANLPPSVPDRRQQFVDPAHVLHVPHGQELRSSRLCGDSHVSRAGCDLRRTVARADIDQFRISRQGRRAGFDIRSRVDRWDDNRLGARFQVQLRPTHPRRCPPRPALPSRLRPSGMGRLPQRRPRCQRVGR